MTRYLAFLTTAFLVGGLSTDALSVAQAGHGEWAHDYESARAESQRTGKPMLLHFHAAWCGPCRQMDAQTLHQPSVMAMLATDVVGVKIDCQYRQDLVQKYGVSQLPSDLIVDAGGQVISRTSGFKSAGMYVSSIGPTARAASRRFQPRPQRQVPEPTLDPSGDLGVQLADRDRQQDRTQSQSPMQRPQAKPIDETPPPVMVVSNRPPMLRGYSPVALHLDRAWTKGRQEFAVEYRGQVYRMSTAEERDQFNANPRRYTPRLLGCDPIVFNESDRAVMGNLKYAAFYGEELYLFQNDENRRKFHDAPDRYTTTRVVQLKDIETVTR